MQFLCRQVGRKSLLNLGFYPRPLEQRFRIKNYRLKTLRINTLATT